MENLTNILKYMAILLMVVTVSLTTSCKKDSEKDKEGENTEKERVTELLVSTTWYYETYKPFGEELETCFDGESYFEFKSDGKFVQRYRGLVFNGTYSVNADGKTITDSYGGTITITSINQSTFKFKLGTANEYDEYALSKTAGTCAR